MALEIKKQEKENPQGLVRRFSKRIRSSGILLRARKIRFHERKKSRQMRKKSALKREELRIEYEKLEKSGKIKEERVFKRRI